MSWGGKAFSRKSDAGGKGWKAARGPWKAIHAREAEEKKERIVLVLMAQGHKSTRAFCLSITEELYPGKGAEKAWGLSYVFAGYGLCGAGCAVLFTAAL